MNNTFKLTQKQKEALDKISQSPLKHMLLYGGSQSAKTFFGLYFIIMRALKYHNSRHAVCRHKQVDIQASILLTLFPAVINKRFFPNSDYDMSRKMVRYHMSPPLYVEFLQNKSLIFFLGLDERANDKILGRQYSTVLLDEISEIPYSFYSKIWTRLSEKSGAKKVSLCTMNPTTKRHWSYKLFIEKQEPSNNLPLDNPQYFDYLNVNPSDNIENLPKDYMDILENLPPQDKERFLYGRFSNDLTGVTYAKEISDAFTQERISSSISLDPNHSVNAVLDLGIADMMAVWIVQFLPDKLIFLESFYKNNTSLIDIIKEIFARGHKINTLFLPHDAKNRWVGNALSVENLARRFSQGSFFVKTLKRQPQWVGISATRMAFNKFYFKTPECDAGVDALSNYKYAYDPTSGLLNKPTPKHDWASHIADALRYCVMAYQYAGPQIISHEEKKPSDGDTFADILKQRGAYI